MQWGPRTLIFLVLLLALPVAAYFCMFQPQQEKLKLAQAEIKAKREKLVALEHATAEVKNLPGEIEKLRKAVSFFESKLPEEKEMDKVLREIWQIAEKNGLNVKSVRSLKAVWGADYSEQPIRMLIVGQFGSFYSYLRSVEQLPRITRVSDMTLDKDPKIEGQMSAEFTLTVYFERGKGDQRTSHGSSGADLARVEMR